MSKLPSALRFANRVEKFFLQKCSSRFTPQDFFKTLTKIFLKCCVCSNYPTRTALKQSTQIKESPERMRYLYLKSATKEIPRIGRGTWLYSLYHPLQG